MTAPQATPAPRTRGRLLFLVAVPLAYARLLFFHPIPVPGASTGWITT